MKYVQKRWYGSKSKKEKKKKGKKKVETPPESSSDDGSSSDSESSSEEPVVVKKKSKRKGKKEKQKKTKKGKKSKKQAAAAEPIDLFQPNPAPVPQQASNDDEWAKFDDGDWDAFGPSSAPATQAAPAPVQKQPQNNFFSTPAPQQNWQQPQTMQHQPVPQHQSKANSGISPNDPFFAAFQTKPQTSVPTQAQPSVTPAAKVNDPFAELMASSTQSTNSTPEKVNINTGPNNPFGASTQPTGNPFGAVPNTGVWGAAPQPAAPQQNFGMQRQQYGYPPQTQQQQQYGYPPQTQHYGYPPQTQPQYRAPQQQQFGYPPQTQQQQQYMQQNFANMNLQQNDATQQAPGGGANPWA